MHIVETQCFGFHSSTKRAGCVEQKPPRGVANSLSQLAIKRDQGKSIMKNWRKRWSYKLSSKV